MKSLSPFPSNDETQTIENPDKQEDSADTYLCDGRPQCSKVCQEGNWDALETTTRSSWQVYKIHARKPEEITRELVRNLYGEFGEGLI